MICDAVEWHVGAGLPGGETHRPCCCSAAGHTGLYREDQLADGSSCCSRADELQGNFTEVLSTRSNVERSMSGKIT